MKCPLTSLLGRGISVASHPLKGGVRGRLDVVHLVVSGPSDEQVGGGLWVGIEGRALLLFHHSLSINFKCLFKHFAKAN